MPRPEVPPPGHWDWHYVPKRRFIMDWVLRSITGKYPYETVDIRSEVTPEPLLFMGPNIWDRPPEAAVPTYRLRFHREYQHAAWTDQPSYWTWIVGKDDFDRWVSLPAERHYYEVPSWGDPATK